MAPRSLLVSDQSAPWHLDAARGPSTPSFDHLVGAGEELRRNLNSKRLSRLEVDDQIELGWSPYWHIGRLCTFKNFCNVNAKLAVHFASFSAVAAQRTGSGKLTKIGHDGNLVRYSTSD